MLRPYPKDIMDSFLPVTKGFQSYPAESWSFIHAELVGIDAQTREVIYKAKNENEELAETDSTIKFDTLVIATGSKGPSPVYSYHGGHVNTLNAYKDIHARLPSAKSVMVIGGGSAGTETAGELGYLHGKKTAAPKEIKILSGSERLLPALSPNRGQRAEEVLNGMGVTVEHKLRLTDSKKLDSGATEVTLSDGSTRTVDILLVATGRYPASSYLSEKLLDKTGKVTVDEYMRIPSIPSAYAVGDIASNSPGGIMTIMTAVPTTFGNVVAELAGKGKGKEWKPMTTKETQAVPLGPEQGVGSAFGWWMPSFLVKTLKGKNMMFPNAEKVCSLLMSPTICEPLVDRPDYLVKQANRVSFIDFDGEGLINWISLIRRSNR